MIPFVAIGPGPDYPAAADVESGVVYDFGNLTGTLNVSGGGSGLTTEQAAQLAAIADAVELLTDRRAVEVVSPVGLGGALSLYRGDDYLVASDSELVLPVVDAGGAIYARLNAAGVGNLRFGASRGNRYPSLIVGTVNAISYASNVLSIVLEIEAAGEQCDALPADDYVYHISRTAAGGRNVIEVAGSLTLSRRRVELETV